MSGALLIMDDQGGVSTHHDTVFLWNSFAESSADNVTSLPELVEKNAKVLRSEIIHWLRSIPSMEHNNVPLMEALVLPDGSNYWWLTLFAEKCNSSKSRWLNELAKIAALLSEIKNFEIQEVQIHLKQKEVATCLKLYFESLGASVTIKEKTGVSSKAPIKRAIEDFLHPVLLGMGWLIIQIFRRLPLIFFRKKYAKELSANTIFFSILSDISQTKLTKKQFESGYWGDLPKILKEDKHSCVWLYLFDHDHIISSSYTAKNIINKLNKIENDKKQIHLCLEYFWEVSLIPKYLREWFFVFFTAKKFKGIAQRQRFNGVNVWPLMKADWESSFEGACLRVSLYQKALIVAAEQTLLEATNVVYLQENQSWERSIIQAWSGNKKVRLFGYPHATVRFWDLRYCHDQIKVNDIILTAPSPDRIVVTNNWAFNHLKENGYASSTLQKAFPLRYAHIVDPRNSIYLDKKKATKSKLIVVLGSHEYHTNNYLIKFLGETYRKFGCCLTFKVRSHPSTPFWGDQSPPAYSSFTNVDLAQLVNESAVFVSTTVTSAVVDVYSHGAPLIIVEDANTPNLSPLRGLSNVTFVRTPEAFMNACLSVANLKNPSKQQFFYVDQEISSWLDFLNE